MGVLKPDETSTDDDLRSENLLALDAESVKDGFYPMDLPMLIRKTAKVLIVYPNSHVVNLAEVSKLNQFFKEKHSDSWSLQRPQVSGSIVSSRAL